MRMSVIASAVIAGTLGLAAQALPAFAQEDLIFRKSTVWKMLTPNDKLAVYGVDDPIVEGVACHYTIPEKGGVTGMFGVAEEVSEISPRTTPRRLRRCSPTRTPRPRTRR